MNHDKALSRTTPKENAPHPNIESAATMEKQM
jgi:hypothetical protein